ncbi:MAG: class I SAM-dependent methyltransferase [Opitutales bacterium]
MMTEEGQRLGEHWDRISPGKLDSYMIQEVEHPAYNAQSVLIRAFIIDRLFPGEAAEIIEAELYYSACASAALAANREGNFARFYHALRHGATDYLLPPFLNQAHSKRFAGYFDLDKLLDDLAIGLSVGFDHFKSPFEKIWHDFLRERTSQPCRLMEFGCGSANDYRMWAATGLDARVRYRGIDVSSSNIANARKRFPCVDFAVGDICQVEAEDAAFDITLAFDVYEHLSPAALGLALRESLRVTRDECWMSFFNADTSPQHSFREVEDYHWNRLSLPVLVEEIKASGFEVELYSVQDVLASKFEGYQHYNQEAHILVARRRNLPPVP